MKPPTVVQFESKERKRAHARADRITDIVDSEEYSDLSEPGIYEALLCVIARVVESVECAYCRNVHRQVIQEDLGDVLDQVLKKAAERGLPASCPTCDALGGPGPQFGAQRRP
jgi:hypothetical protein